MLTYSIDIVSTQEPEDQRVGFKDLFLSVPQLFPPRNSGMFAFQTPEEVEGLVASWECFQ